MVLKADKLKMEQGRVSRNKPMHLRSTIFGHRCQKDTMEKGQSFLLDWTTTRMKLDLYLIVHTKINLKWINDLNIRSRTVKLLKDNREDVP